MVLDVSAPPVSMMLVLQQSQVSTIDMINSLAGLNFVLLTMIN